MESSRTSRQRRGGQAVTALAVLAFVAYCLVLAKLHHDANAPARSAPSYAQPAGSGPGTDDVVAAWKARFDGSLAGKMRVLGCSPVSGTQDFSCRLFLTSDGKVGYRATESMHRIGACTGTRHCIEVDGAYYRVATPQSSLVHP